MNEIKFYLDDYQTIKAYFYKPFNTCLLMNMQVLNHQVAVPYHIEELVQNDEYYKCVIILEEEFNYEDEMTFVIDQKPYELYLRHIVSNPKFEADFFTDINALGPHFAKTETTFKLWSPLAKGVRLHLLDYQKYCDMEDIGHGVYSVSVDGNYELSRYRYEISRNGKMYEICDPLAYSSGPNGSYSYVLDEDKFISQKYQPSNIIEHYTDAIIYELSVRDFTSSPISGTTLKGKFVALCEEGTTFEGQCTGLDYLKSLGVTHVQLMPVFDFGSIDENHPRSYNWGYDPTQYNVTEGTYCSDLSNPYLRVNELRMLVNKLHENDMRVNLDVVFNHVYQDQEFDLGQVLPHYLYRYENDEELANGSFCGNEVRSEALMMRSYIRLMCSRYLKIFDIDGLRFDLMGLTDVKTIQEILNDMQTVKKDFMIYGEGWDMASGLEPAERSSLNNSAKLKNVAFFNPKFRDEIKGPTMYDAVYQPGYVLGELSLAGAVKDDLLGNCLNGYLPSPCASINYLECHDNLTFYDKMRICLRNQSYEDEKARACLGLALVLLAQGIPFIHSGQEFMRTKYGNDDTYNSGDYYNQIDYAYRNQNIDVVNFARDLIKIRKEYPELRYATSEEVAKNVKFEDYYEVLVYNTGRLKIFINPSIYDMVYETKRPLKAIYNRDAFDDTIIHKTLKLAPLSIVICELYEE